LIHFYKRFVYIIVMMRSLTSLTTFCLERYKGRTGSIFLDGLVGGMFLSFLLDISEEKCADSGFTNLFFVIGLSHYISKTVGDLVDYSNAAAKKDKLITKMEMILGKAGFIIQHIIRIVQYPMVPALAYYVLKINVVEHDDWTHNQEKEPNKKYCDANDVHIAALTLSFQIVYGFLIVLTWVIMWMVDREDDEEEMEEQRRWQEEEKKQKGTVWGNVKEVILVVSMHSFFDDQVAGTFLALAIALPHESCNIHVTSWFLVAGVVFSLTDVLNKLRSQVEMLAALDGIINKIEHRLIQFLRFINFPLFCMEFIAFVMISIRVTEHWSTIDHKKENLDSGESNPNYCEAGTWQLMVAVMGLYAVVIVFRVAVVVASLTGGSQGTKTD